MLAAGNMLDLLSQNENNEELKNCNDDYDFGTVLEFCSTKNQNYGHELLYSDGQKKVFSFD